MDQWKPEHLQPHKGHQAHNHQLHRIMLTTHTTSILHKALGEHFLVYLEGTLYSRLFLKEERSYTYYSVRVRGILPLPHIQHYLLVEKKRKEKKRKDLTPTP